jgi:hypothetical protein
MKGLVFKELRDIRGIAAIALACYLALVANLMGAKVFAFVPGIPDGTSEVPFTGREFLSYFEWITFVFAAALGFRQTVVESARGTLLFLLHRPLARNVIVLTKLATGLGMFAICVSLPILLYGWWLSVPGHHASPFEWSMSKPAWGVALVWAPSAYFGAFLSGLRPARWFGTRLLPLVAVPAFFLLGPGKVSGPWFISLLISGLVYLVLPANICYMAQVRDYA